LDILRTLADERDIKQGYHRNCNMIDSCPFEGLVDVFTASCGGDYGDFNGIVQEGREALVAQRRSHHRTDALPDSSGCRLDGRRAEHRLEPLRRRVGPHRAGLANDSRRYENYLTAATKP